MLSAFFLVIVVASIQNDQSTRTAIRNITPSEGADAWQLSLQTLHVYADELVQLSFSADREQRVQAKERVKDIVKNGESEIFRLRHAAQVSADASVLNIELLQHLFYRAKDESFNLIDLSTDVLNDRRMLQGVMLTQSVATIHSALSESAEARRAVRTQDQTAAVQGSLDSVGWGVPTLFGLAGLLAAVCGVALQWQALNNRDRISSAVDAEYVRDLAIGAPVGLVVLDLAGTLRWINAAGAGLLHTSRETLIGASILDYMADRNRASDLRGRLQQGESLTAYALDLRTRDGATVNALLDATPCLKEGSFTHMQCVLHDVTGRLQVEQAYRASERRLQAVIDHSPTGVYLTDGTGSCTFVNPKWCELAGMSSERAAGQGWMDALHPDDRKRVQAEWECCAHSGDEFQSEYRYRKPDGVTTWVACRAVALRNEAGQITQYLGNVKDITQRKLAEERLRQSEARFELAVRGSNDVVWDWNTQTDEVYHSPRLAELLGYDHAAMQHNKQWLFELMHPDDRASTQASLEAHLKSETPFDIEHRMRTIGGEYRWFHSRGRMVRDAAGQPTRMVGTMSDITAQKRQEEALREYASEAEKSRARIEGQACELSRQAELLREVNQVAKAASEAKGRFLANMSHEIRTPLNAILGMTQLALDGELRRDQRKLLDTVYSSGEHLLSLINDILDFSKIEAGKLDLESAPFSVRDCIQRTLSMFHLTAENKCITLQAELAEGVPQSLIGDERRVRQILVNLVGNAIKFTSQGEVAVLVQAGSGESTKPRWHFLVRDTGIGIPADKLDSIFRPFEQADTSTTRQFGGTGLGLSIVAALVDLMHGRAWVESELGSGSTFHFEIELAIAQEEAFNANSVPHRRITDNASAMGPLKVLIADDDEFNQQLVMLLLQKQGFQLTQVDDGEAAVHAAAAQSFDLILMDMQMPRMSGLEATLAIREAEQAANTTPVPIIALTANVMEGDRVECLAVGMNGYVAKPIRREELFGEISRVLSRQPAAPALTPNVRRMDGLHQLLDELANADVSPPLPSNVE